MKYLTIALVLLISTSVYSQGGTQSVSFSLKDKFSQMLSESFSKVVSEADSPHQVSISPNPVTSHLHVNSTGMIKKILLIDFEGKVVKRVRLKDVKSFTFDTSSLPKGDYKVVISHYDQKKVKLDRRI